MDAVDREDAEREVVHRKDQRIRGAHWAALIVLSASALSWSLVTSKFGVHGFVIAYGAAAGAWLVARRAPLSLRTAIVLAIALRAAFLVVTPQLSDDVWRYLFDGRTLASGHDPYTVLPDDPRVNHREIPTIYPPHAEILFAAVHWLPLWRLLLITCDVAAILLLREHAVALALFPPLLVESAWSAHVESVAALLLLVAWQRRSGAAAAGAVGMKVIPIAAVPALFLRASKRVRFALVFALVLIVPMIPFALAGPLMPGLRDYATRWVFNSPLYDATFAVVDWTRLAPHLKSFFTSIKDTLHLERIAHFVYFHLYADYLTRAFLGVLAIVAIAIAAKRRATAASIGALLLCSPAIHPWYWIVLVPTAMAEGAAIWIAFALCAPFSYLLYAGAPWLMAWALCYALPLTMRLRPSATATSGAGSPAAAPPTRTARDTSPS